MPYETIEYAERDGYAELTFDRPAVLNAYTEAMLDEIHEALERATAADDVSALLVTGNGRGFCSGVDLNESRSHGDSKRDFELHRRTVDGVYRTLYAGPTPTVAAVNGPAIGAGFGFAICCDVVVVREDAYLRDQHVENGLAPSVAAGVVLPRLVGETRAREILLQGTTISADEAAEMGLATRVEPADGFREAAREVAADLAAKPDTATRLTKELLAADHSFEEYTRAAIDAQWECRRARAYRDTTAEYDES